MTALSSDQLMTFGMVTVTMKSVLCFNVVTEKERENKNLLRLTDPLLFDKPLVCYTHTHIDKNHILLVMDMYKKEFNNNLNVMKKRSTETTEN